MDALSQQITQEAADWLVRLDDDASGQSHGDFVTWLKRSPRHMDEFLMVEATYRTLEQHQPRDRGVLDALLVESSAEVIPLLSAPHGVPRNSERTPKVRRLAPWAVAAALAVVTLVLTIPRILPSTPYLTAIGEQRTFKLPDGSRLTLNTQSRVDIDFSDSARKVRLVRGEALFTVKADAKRPFSVSTDTATVLVLGTSFNVYRKTDRSTFVSVLEGRVKVAARAESSSGTAMSSEALALTAGEEARVSESAGVVRRAAPDVEESTSWQLRRLIFRSTPLGDVVAEFNRYNPDVELRVYGDEIAQRRITATFDADEPEAFLRFLAEDPGIRLDRSGTAIAIELEGAR